MKTKFKIGDKVKCINDPFAGFPTKFPMVIGKVYTVSRVSGDDLCVNNWVRLFMSSQFQLVKK